MEPLKAALAQSAKYGFRMWLGLGTVNYGWALAEQGHLAEGIQQMRAGLAELRSAGCMSCLYRPHYLGLLARALADAGEVDEGLRVLAEALAAAADIGERAHEAELHRLRGELLLMGPGDEAQAEACYARALDVARGQSARSLELRAAMSLGRLWQAQGRTGEARQMLTEVYGWFTEGFDTCDLKEAKALIGGLAT
jgi:predicted ATPase